MASCYWSISGASGWLVNWECAFDAGTSIGCYHRSYMWSEPDQYMYVKEELTWWNRFGTVHIVTVWTEKQGECISNSYPPFIKVLQPVTLSIPAIVPSTVSVVEEEEELQHLKFHLQYEWIFWNWLRNKSSFPFSRMSSSNAIILGTSWTILPSLRVKMSFQHSVKIITSVQYCIV